MGMSRSVDDEGSDTLLGRYAERFKEKLLVILTMSDVSQPDFC